MRPGCDQEMCPYWDGHGCPCEVFDISPEARDAERVRCGFPSLLNTDEDEDDPADLPPGYGPCGVCGIEGLLTNEDLCHDCDEETADV